MEAATILKQGADFKFAIDKMMANGGGFASDSGSAPKISFSGFPETTQEVALTPPLSASSTLTPHYMYHNQGYTVDSGIIRHMVLRLDLSSKEYCQMINHLALGKPLASEPPAKFPLGEAGEACFAMLPTLFVYTKIIVENVPGSSGKVVVGRGTEAGNNPAPKP